MSNEARFNDVLSFFLWNAFNSVGRKFQIVPFIKSIVTFNESEGNSGLVFGLWPKALVASKVTLVVALGILPQNFGRWWVNTDDGFAQKWA